VRTYDEIMATARDEAPFSNGTECSAWMENWCWQPCFNPAEKSWQDYENGKRKHPHKDYPGGCPLIMAALNGKTPTEWLEQDSTDGIRLGDQFHCIEFRGPNDGGSDSAPRPRRDPRGMDPLFPQPERHVRMLKQPEPVKELEPAGR
jgi:hypothetical protein